MSYGGSSGGAGRIATAADAALSNPATSDVLTYNSSTQKWTNAPAAVAVAATSSVAGTVRLTGDLAGTSVSPVVAKVNGIAMTGTPTVGQALIATSASAASWQTISGGTGDLNLDGGTPSTTYGGTTGFNGGTP